MRMAELAAPCLNSPEPRTHEREEWLGVRFGSVEDIGLLRHDVRFVPKADIAKFASVMITHCE
jgi:hypothetical protein